MKIKVYSSDGKLWSINESNLGEALNRGGKLANVGNKVNVVSSDDKPWTINTKNLPEALKRGGKLAEPSLLDRTREFGQGVAKGLGTLPDLANQYVAAPAVHLTGLAAEGASYVADKAGFENTSKAIGNFANKAHELGYQYQNSNIGEQLANASVLQTDTIPDETSDVLKASGSTATDLIPFSLTTKGVGLITKAGGQFAAPWLTRLNNFLKVDINAKNAASFAGMGAGGELARSKDPETSESENVLREVLGGIAGGITAVPLATKPLQALSSLIKDPLKPIRTIATETKDIFYSTAAFLLRGNKLNTEAIEAAKKLGVQLTPKDLSNSAIAAFTQNNLLNSIFTSKAYHEVIENSSKALIESIDETLSKVGTKIEGTESESALSTGIRDYQDLLKQQNEEWRNESSKLYDKAMNLISTKDAKTKLNQVIEQEEKDALEKATVKDFIGGKHFVPTKNIKLIEQQKAQSLTEKNHKINKDFVTAKKTKFAVDKLIKDLSFGATKAEGDKAVVLNKLKGLQTALKEPVHLRDLFQERSDLNRAAGEFFGYKELFKSIAGIIEKDIDSFKGNKEFIKAWKNARKYNQEMIQTRVKTDTARKILTAEQPTEALKYMNSATDVKEMEKIIGTDLDGEAGENAQLLMGKLKRARIDQYFKSKNIITADNNFNADAFIRIFERNVDEDFLKSLVGSNYNTLKENISPIATAISQSNKTLSNKSQTANVGKDIGIIAGGTYNVLQGNLSGAALSGATGLALNAISKIFTNPEIAQKIIQKGKILEKKGTFTDKAKKINRKFLENPAVKYQTVNYGINEALPTYLFDDDTRKKLDQRKREIRELRRSKQ